MPFAIKQIFCGTPSGPTTVWRLAVARDNYLQQRKNITRIENGRKVVIKIHPIQAKTMTRFGFTAWGGLGFVQWKKSVSGQDFYVVLDPDKSGDPSTILDFLLKSAMKRGSKLAVSLVRAHIGE